MSPMYLVQTALLPFIHTTTRRGLSPQQLDKKKQATERLPARNHPTTLYFVGVVGCRFAEAEPTVAYGHFIGKTIKVLP